VERGDESNAWSRAVGACGGAYVFMRDRHYSLTDSATGEVQRHDVRQRNQQLRVYIAMNSVR
jgi:hypothetical protein